MKSGPSHFENVNIVLQYKFWSQCLLSEDGIEFPVVGMFWNAAGKVAKNSVLPTRLEK